MHFVPYEKISGVANIIVDGSATENTLLTLSHWPKSGTPPALKRDTSAEITFAYLESSQYHVPALAASNNHFDEDGVVGLFALIDSAVALPHRELLIDAAQAGDFGIYTRRAAARIAFVLSAYADGAVSPLPAGIFELPYSQLAARLYVEALNIMPRLLTDPDEFRRLWEPEDARLTSSESALDAGDITIEERPELDLAIVRMPDDLRVLHVHRFTQQRTAECHPLAIHNRTQCKRLMHMWIERVEFQYRYESWVQFVSRRPLPRIDLSPLVDDLNIDERSGGRWQFGGVDQIAPRLFFEPDEGRPVPSSIQPEDVLQRLIHRLQTGTPAWDPYD